MVSDVLKNLERLDFSGKGEAFVEQKFLTPLLECLGYDEHKDYEVVRHGDDGASFKLNYPPVEKGAQRVKHYNPDYRPTIRKKMFWIIEAKSPKDVVHPFDSKFLVQGLQYCIHPEIQAQYLLLSNGKTSSLFDAHGAVFLGKEMYEPILEFHSSELSAKWPEIYSLLGVEKLRSRIEADLKTAFDKLCMSSLDSTYPRRLLGTIGASAGDNANLIARNVNKMRVQLMDENKAAWEREIKSLTASEVLDLMDDPMTTGTTAAHYFINKSFEEGHSPDEILARLTHDYERQSIFRKEHSFLAVCFLYLRVEDTNVMKKAKLFLDTHKDAPLPLLNQVECALLRFERKSNVLRVYPALREKVALQLQSAPELVKFVETPSAFTLTYEAEVANHHRTFEVLKRLSDVELQKLLALLLPMESAIHEEFKTARSTLSDSERQILGFEIYGEGGRHYFFRGVLHNYGIEKRPDLPQTETFTANTPKALQSL
jgi:hypothetical protein